MTKKLPARPRNRRGSKRSRQSRSRRWLWIVALAGLVLFKGLPVLAGIALGLGEMIVALTRL